MISTAPLKAESFFSRQLAERQSTASLQKQDELNWCDTMSAVILTIDDDKTTHHFVSKALGEEFELQSAMNGEEGIDLAHKHKPDIVLLDVEMPGMTGYEVCDKIRHDSELSDVPVVFLSTHSSLQERMHGYEVGGTDYLVKPFEPDTLRAKLTVLAERHNHEVELKKSAADAQKTAMIALSSTAELGQVIQFVESIAGTSDHHELAQQILKTSTNMSLNAVLYIKTDRGPIWASCAEEVSPLEIQVMTMLREEKRINDFGTRTVINYPLVSMMVKNMPNDDPERYGRIKDIVPAILTTANGKIEALNSNAALSRQSIDLTETFEKAQASLSGLFEQSHGYQQKVDQTLRAMFEELQTRLPYMGLDEDQEVYIVERIDSSIIGVRDIEDQSMQVFGNIQETLQDLADLVERVKAADQQQAETVPKGDGPTDEVHSVELF